MEQSQQTPNVNKLSPEIKAKAREAGASARALMDRAAAHQPTPIAGESASSHGGNREAMMHTQGAPDKTQQALSPTDSHKGQSQTQQKQMQRGRSLER